MKPNTLPLWQMNFIKKILHLKKQENQLLDLSFEKLQQAHQTPSAIEKKAFEKEAEALLQQAKPLREQIITLRYKVTFAIAIPIVIIEIIDYLFP